MHVCYLVAAIVRRVPSNPTLGRATALLAYYVLVPLAYNRVQGRGRSGAALCVLSHCMWKFTYRSLQWAKQRNTRHYISYICLDAPWRPVPVCTNVGLLVRPMHVFFSRLCNVLLYSVNGFRFYEGPNFGHSHQYETLPSTQGWSCHSACDISEIFQVPFKTFHETFNFYYLAIKNF